LSCHRLYDIYGEFVDGDDVDVSNDKDNNVCYNIPYKLPELKMQTLIKAMNILAD
jgi:hypothetical protein